MVKKLEGAGLRGQVAGETSLSTVGQIEGLAYRGHKIETLAEKASFEDMFGGVIPVAFKTLLDSDKVLLSPHVGGWTKESYYKLSDVLADKITNRFCI